MLTEAELQREAAATGFGTEVLEKAIRLLELLETIRSHPFLKSRVVLKGGTALNLFIFDVPRLSVDIDLNYVGEIDGDDMTGERSRLNQAIVAVCGRLGMQTRRTPREHAGGKWRFAYTTVAGRPGTLELDVNFMFRTPLWPRAAIDSRSLGTFAAKNIPVLDVHELAAGKLAALFARGAGRDLFDVRELLRLDELDRDRLRLGFVVYGGINRRDWRDVSLADVRAEPEELDRLLLPMLRRPDVPPQERVSDWTEQLVAETIDLLEIVLPLAAHEREFLELLNDQGKIAAELLTGDTQLQDTLRAHPGLRWKALNVRRHFGLPDGDAT